MEVLLTIFAVWAAAVVLVLLFQFIGFLFKR
jgi:hypothetical protein